MDARRTLEEQTGKVIHEEPTDGWCFWYCVARFLRLRTPEAHITVREMVWATLEVLYGIEQFREYNTDINESWE